jgi:hypothetical protein
MLMDKETRTVLACLGVLEALELGDDDRVELVGRATRSDLQPGQGASLRSTVVSLALLLANPLLAPALLQPVQEGVATMPAEAPSSASALGDLPAQIARHQSDHGVVVLFDLKAAVRALAGTVDFPDSEGGEMVVLDGRASPAVVHLAAEGREWVLTNDARDVRLYEIRRAVPDQPRFSPAPALDLSSVHPSPVEWLAGSACEPWLPKLAAELADSPWVVDRAAAAGAVARLWNPTDPAERLRALSAIADSPPTKARLWARSLDPAAAAEIERAAIYVADSFFDALTHLQEAAAEESATQGSIAADLVLRRDDLESVAFALGCAGEGGALRERLDELDREAVAHLSELPCGDWAENERLLAVSWMEPTAWWGRLALG